jgi:hypothetical protein
MNSFASRSVHVAMSNPNKLLPADPSDLTAVLAFGLRPHGRKSHFADEPIVEIVAKHLVEYLDRAASS